MTAANMAGRGYPSPLIQYQIPIDETSVSGIPTNDR